MPKKTYRIGVIGAGAIAQACHIPGYAASGRCRLVALADPNAACREEVREKGFAFDAEYDDYRAMLREEELDAVSICSPNKYHKSQAVACLKRGLTVLLEKPVALTLAEARAIGRAEAEHGGRVMVGFTHRFMRLNRAARKAIRAGRIGTPYMIRIRFAHTGPLPGWARTGWFHEAKVAGGGAILDMGIHAFDMAAWYLGPVAAVQARAVALRKKIEVDDNAVVLLEFGQNALGYVEVGWTSPAGFCGVEIMGDDGALVVDYGAGEARLTAGTTSASGKRSQKTRPLPLPKGADGWPAEMAYFTGRLDRRHALEPTLDDGTRALAMALAAMRSSKTGRRVAVEA